MRSSLLFATLAALLCLGATAQAQTPARADRDCFRNEEIAGWGLIDATHVRVRVNSRRAYALTTQRDASRLRWEMQIAVTSSSGSICVGDDIGVQIESHGSIPHFYLVDAVARIPDPATEDAPAEPGQR